MTGLASIVTSEYSSIPSFTSGGSTVDARRKKSLGGGDRKRETGRERRGRWKVGKEGGVERGWVTCMNKVHMISLEFPKGFLDIRVHRRQGRIFCFKLQGGERKR